MHPNILIITLDSWRFNALGCVNPAVITPHIDQFASEGVNFTNTYCAAPECGPSRAAMLTGLPPHRNGRFANCPITLDGVYHSDKPYAIHDGVPTLPSIAQSHGYQQLQLPVTNGLGQEYLDMLTARGFGHVAHPRGCDERGMWYVPQLSALPDELHLSHFTGDAILASLEQWRTAPQGPFLMEVTFNKPHAPFAPPSSYHEMYSPGAVDGAIQDEPYCPEEWNFYHRWQNRGKAPWGQTPDFLNRLQRVGYYAEVSFVDHQIGRILDWLDSADLRENTVLVITGDHGDMLGDHFLYGKRSWYDAAARVPLLISAPGKLDGEHICDSLVSHLDVLPTLLDLCDITHDTRDLAGKSLRHLLDGSVAARNHLFGQYAEGEMAIYMSMDLRYKYSYAAAEEKEWLFDLAEDPLETRNLADRPDCAEVKERLRQALFDYFRSDEYLAPLDGEGFRRFPASSTSDTRP